MLIDCLIASPVILCRKNYSKNFDDPGAKKCAIGYGSLIDYHIKKMLENDIIMPIDSPFT